MSLWFLYSIIAAIFLAISFLFIKKASLMQIPISLLTLYLWGFASIMLLVFLLFKKGSIVLSSSQLLVSFLAGFAFLIGALLLNKAVSIAPNPGFATAVGSLQVLIVIIASYFLFSSDLTFIKVLGSIFVVSGVILLGIK